jgi:two-component system, sensor histidine kinase and response regulator
VPPPILIVDDQRANLLAAAAVLEPLGHPLITASSGAAALRLVLEHDFVLILMDVQMPELDGYETVALLRGSSRSRDIPIVFLTAVYDQPEHTHRGYELGAADYISKPFDADVLRGKIRALASLYMRGQRSEKERSEKMNHLKDLFLGAVGHDLRDPLNSIKMAAHLLAATNCPEDARLSHANRIERAAERMNRVIEDILDLTRSQFTGGIPLKLEPTDLGSLCRGVIAEFRLFRREREVQLDVRGDVIGEWDSGRLARVVSNLVGNAIQHSEGLVHVSVVGETRTRSTSRQARGDCLHRRRHVASRRSVGSFGDAGDPRLLS